MASTDILRFQRVKLLVRLRPPENGARNPAAIIALEKAWAFPVGNRQVKRFIHATKVQLPAFTPAYKPAFFAAAANALL